MENIDLYMSGPSGDDPGGDLELAAPVTDADGNQVVDLALSYGQDVIKQIVYARIKTQAPDWFVHPELGGNLEDLIGEPNTRETADKGVTLITNALKYGDFLEDTDFTIRVMPVNRDEILFVIRIFNDREEILIPIQFSYSYGMKLVEG
jgi:hypothetical protein